jgi:hypothetical protein
VKKKKKNNERIAAMKGTRAWRSECTCMVVVFGGAVRGVDSTPPVWREGRAADLHDSKGGGDKGDTKGG